MTQRIKYRVHYGRHLSSEDFTSWRAACDFMRALLRNYEDVRISTVEVE